MTKKSNDLKEGGKKMKSSKGICLLAIALIVLLAFPAQGSAEAGGWLVSDDDSVEVRFISWEEVAYPSYRITLQFRLDRQQLSDRCSFEVDMSDTINSYIVNNQTAKNRKVKVDSERKVLSLTLVNGTYYVAVIPCIVGGTTKIEIPITFDLASVYPDEFVNSDALIAATCLKNLLNLLGNPSEYSFSDFSMMRSKKDDAVYFYTFSFTAPNKSGGKTTVTVDANYNVSDGSAFFSLRETDQLFHVGENWLGLLPMLTEMAEICDEAVTIPASSVLKYVK